MGNRFYRFMIGRYGMDKLGYAVIITAMAVSIISVLLGIRALTLISYALLIWEIYRFLSKNTYKRAQENQKFYSISDKAKKKFTLTKNKLRDRKTHRYFECSTCRNTLRVPKGKGEVKVTCPVCKTITFIKT